MTAGWCSRAVRAAVFAAVCVVLAALGHVMMSGASVPWWAVAAGVAATGAAAWLLAERERGPFLVVSTAVAAQAALHASFAFAQAVAQPRTPGGGAFARRWMDHMLCGPPPAPGAGHHAVPMSMHPADHHMGAMETAPMSHGMGGVSPTGMLVAHLLAAVACGLWLAHGERAAFRVLRVLAGLLAAPLRLLLRLPATPHRPRVRTRRTGSDRAPRPLLLTHTITSRGPPAGTAAA